MFLSLVTFLLVLPLVYGWMPSRDGGIIRGVNLGGLFIIEPWMMESEWQAMGCGAYASEFDCVSGLGQYQADVAFRKHWNTWITKADFAEMSSYGINTVRIPLGYWMKEDLVYRNSEHFPTGAFRYLERVVMWAKQYNIYVILDLHGAPGAQLAKNPFTGQNAPTAGFYVSYQYQRAYEFLSWITNIVHTNPAFSTVGAIEILNEPLAYTPSVTSTLTTVYYPGAVQTIRAVESKLRVAGTQKLHIMMMNEAWGAGDPLSNLQDTTNLLFDDHHYVKWDTAVQASCSGYMTHSCTDSRLTAGSKIPQITGEWSLSVADAVQNAGEFAISPLSANTKAFYVNWFIAQLQSYEQTQGWIYWAWKITLDDWRWGYQAGVQAGVIPKDLAAVKRWDVCTSYKAKREVPVLEAEVSPVVNQTVPVVKAASRIAKPRLGRRHVHHSRNFVVS